MNSEELTITVPGGTLAALDHRGEGRDVLCIHDLGFSAAYWLPLVFELQGRCRVVSMDLRGHAHSTAQVEHAGQIVDDIRAVIDQVGLDQPILVSNNLIGFHASAAAKLHGDVVGGLLCIGGAMVYTEERTRSMLDMLTSTAFLSDLKNRYHFGASGGTPQTRQELIDELYESGRRDWIVQELGQDSLINLEREIPLLEDGSWYRQPTLESLANTWDLAHCHGLWPDISLYDDFPVPLWVLHPNDGPDADAGDAALELTQRIPHGRFIEVNSGHHTVTTHTEATAHILRDFAALLADLEADRTPQSFTSERINAVQDRR